MEKINAQINAQLTPENKKIAAACALTAVTVGTLSAVFTARRQRRGLRAGDAAPVAAAAPASLHPEEKEKQKEKEKEKTSIEIYESLESARQYMEFHFTPTRDSYIMKLRTISESYDFPTRIAQKFKIYLPAVSAATATVRASSEPNASGAGAASGKVLKGLDLGCATGASVFEMSKYFDEVVGLDYSHAFIQLANEVKESGAASFNNKKPKVAYKAIVQGELTEPREASAPRNTFPERCSFVVGDAMNLFENPSQPEMFTVPEGTTYDGVLCVNLLDRVPDPMVVLHSFAKLLHRRGVLVLCDPYSWMENATPKDKWLGGLTTETAAATKNEFGGKKSEEVVKEILSKDFDLRVESEEAFLIRDHVRHYQLGFSHCTVWIRK